jgi:glycerophosphoryl diester phosphodiesterase
LVEFDILLTKDDEVVVFHDRYLSRVTDVAAHPHFADRAKEEAIDD